MTESDFIKEVVRNKTNRVQLFSDKEGAEFFIEEIYRFLFVGTSYESNGDLALDKFSRLKNSLASLIAETLTNKLDTEKHTTEFFYYLPEIYNALMVDAEAILNFDPAAQNLSEVIVTYPGFYATVVHRLSHQLWIQGVRLLPRLFSEHAHSKTGIDIHPGAKIGSAFAIDHGTGIVIGETTVIGNNVKIYQGVTLGALNVDKALASSKRHPTIQDDVVIYSGATILGGNTVIGQGSIIGGNVWLTNSVPSNSVVYHKSEIKIKDRDPFPEPLNFVI
jgi:serine O-acetyltransferase